MLSISKMSAGSIDYFLNLVRYFIKFLVGRRGPGEDDPYFDDPDLDPLATPGEAPGWWLGTGAAALGLRGTVLKEQLARVFRGVHPHTEQPLVQNADSKTRVPGWDLTFSLPKTASIAWSQGDWNLRESLDQIFQWAARESIHYLEDNFAFSRIGKAGAGGHVPVGLVVAGFCHRTSRAEDPQVHFHMLVQNVGVDAAGKARALDSRILYPQKMLVGAYFRALVAYRLTADHRFRCERRGNSFEIVGIPEPLRLAHSKRRKEILDELHRKGVPLTAREAAIATLDTRKKKPDILKSLQEHLDRWQPLNVEHGLTTEALCSLQNAPAPDTRVNMAEAVQRAVKTITSRQSHFSQRDLLTEVLYQIPESPFPPHLAPNVVDRFLKVGRGVIRLKQVDGETRYTTKAVLRREKHLLRAFDWLNRRGGARVKRRTVKQIVRRLSEWPKRPSIYFSRMDTRSTASLPAMWPHKNWLPKQASRALPPLDSSPISNCQRRRD